MVTFCPTTKPCGIDVVMVAVAPDSVAPTGEAIGLTMLRSDFCSEPKPDDAGSRSYRNTPPADGPFVASSGAPTAARKPEAARTLPNAAPASVGFGLVIVVSTLAV